MNRLNAASGALAVLLLVACSGPPAVEEWQQQTLVARPVTERGEISEDIERVEVARVGLDLIEARDVALALAAENPNDPDALLLASRAESDAVFLFGSGEDQKQNRSLAALSSLVYARRSIDEGLLTAPSFAQLAYSLGTTTHLQPMFSRSGHARETLDYVELALELDPENLTALATLATLRLRLATLPWIAKLMAFGAPDGSVEEAVKLAERCADAHPSIEYRLLLAKALLAADRTDDARAALELIRGTPDEFPRDPELRPAALALLESLAP